MKIGFIGSGNLAVSVIEGLINKDVISGNDIGFFSNDSLEQKKLICEKYKIRSFESNATVIQKSDLIILAVKPNVIFKVLDEIKGCSFDNKIILSVAAGIESTEIIKHLGYDKVIRMMPNILGSVEEGMFALANNPDLTAELKSISDLFGQIGRVVVLNEAYMSAVTAISGSAPAYVFMFIEALAMGGIREGLPAAVAYEIASQVVLGSAKMALVSDMHPAQLRDKVCSPAGTTIEAIASLENDRFTAAVMNAVKKCAEKA